MTELDGASFLKVASVEVDGPTLTLTLDAPDLIVFRPGFLVDRPVLTFSGRDYHLMSIAKHHPTLTCTFQEVPRGQLAP